MTVITETSINIPISVTSIGENAFINNNLPKKDPNLLNAFNPFTKIEKKVTIPRIFQNNIKSIFGEDIDTSIFKYI